MKNLLYVLLCALLAAFSLGAGWFAARQSAPAAGGHDHGAKEPAGHSHAGHDHDGHDHDEKPPLSPQALKNMGVEVKEAAVSSYTMTIPIAAVVNSSHHSEYPLVAPIGGTVREILLHTGSMVESGSIAFRIVRDPLPRPTLTLTEELIKPAAEQFHTSMAELKRAARGVDVLRTELMRVQSFTQGQSGADLPILPRKTEIDLRYELARAEQELESSREKLRLHGLDPTDISKLETGPASMTVSSGIWQRSLKLNGLWPAVAADIYSTLPETLRDTPWSVAAIGELSGAGIATPALAEWLRKEPSAAAQFIAVAGLLQSGSSLEQVQRMHASNALAAVVDVVVPKANGIADWDVADVVAKPNARVEAGAMLAVLHDAREMLLQVTPVGGEVSPLLKAYAEKSALNAEPLVEGSGPPLKDLKILYVASNDHAESKAVQAMLVIPNTPLGVVAEHDFKFRTWQLRAGTRYQLRIPTLQIENAFVLPADALTDDGPDKIVFVKNGETFEPRKVVVRHQDTKTVVLDTKHSDLFPGDEVVVHGAFALGLALKAGSGEADPHAGHMH